MIITILLLCSGVVIDKTRAHEERRSPYVAEIESFNDHNYCDIFQASRHPLVQKNRVVFVHSIEKNSHPTSRLCKKLITSFPSLGSPNPREGPTYMVSSAAIKCGEDVTEETIVGACKVTTPEGDKWVYLVDGQEMNSFYLGMWYRGAIDLIGVIVEKMQIPPESPSISKISSTATKNGDPSEQKKLSEGSSELKKPWKGPLELIKPSEGSAESSLNAESKMPFASVREYIVNKHASQEKRPLDGPVESPLNSSTVRKLDVKARSTALEISAESTTENSPPKGIDVAKKNVAQSKKPAFSAGESSSNRVNESAIKGPLHTGQKSLIQIVGDSAECLSSTHQRNESSLEKSTSLAEQRSTSPTKQMKSQLQLYKYTGQVGVKIFKRPDAVIQDIFYIPSSPIFLRQNSSPIIFTVPEGLSPSPRTHRRDLGRSVSFGNETRNIRNTRGRGGPIQGDNKNNLRQK